MPLVGTVSDSFEYRCKSAVDTCVGIRKGRPFGSLALLWRKGNFYAVSVLDCNSDRLTAIKVTIADRVLILFPVYTRNKNGTVDSSEFMACLGEIDAIVENNDVQDVFILGDFNAHRHK